MSRVIEIATVKTRKAHRCWGCGRDIPAGSQMQITSGVEDGRWWRTYWCQVCVAVTATWHQDDLDYLGLGDVKETEPERWAAEAAKEPK